MKLIDFDAQFARYAQEYIRAHKAEFKNMDEAEAQMPEIYLRWLNQAADWLDGRTPGEWFSQYSDPEELVSLAREYQKAGISLPDQLLERIADLGEAAVPALMKMAGEYEQSPELAMTALNLLIEIGSEQPLELCLDVIERAGDRQELSEVASELLQGLGQAAKEPVLSRMEHAGGEAKAAFLDVLCNFPDDERIYKYAQDAFRTSFDRRALYASYLAKLGDPRAVEVLREALELTDLNYLDYIEIVHAIEALGGEVETEREFNGDPYYESLKDMR